MPLQVDCAHDPDGPRLVLTGTLDEHGIKPLLQNTQTIVTQTTQQTTGEPHAPKRQPSPCMTIDLSNVTGANTAGIAGLVEAVSIANQQGLQVRGTGAVGTVRDQLQRTYIGQKAPPTQTPLTATSLEWWGAHGDHLLSVARSFVQLVADTCYWTIVAPFKRRGAPSGLTTDQALRIGVNALPIVSLIAFLLGLIMAFQAAYQLRQFGANIFVANLVGIAMVRELGPLMTAIIMAGRSGSAIAAELGTMTVGEEIDALRVMGVDPMRYLIAPRVYAITFTQPALTLYANLVGVFGGFLIAVFYLDLSAAAYIKQTLIAVKLNDLVIGLCKSVCFAWVIVLIGSYCGMRISGGPEGVGRATTASVVASIFLIIVVDSIFTTLTTIF